MDQVDQPGTKEYLGLKLHRGHVDRIYQWCKRKYGRSRYNGRYPDIFFKKPHHDVEELWGYYDEVEKYIYINSNKHDSIEDLVHTIIHEYTHYLQSMHHYEILAKYIEDHHKHPLEIEADQVADRDSKECLDYLVSVYGENILNKQQKEENLTKDERIYCQICDYKITKNISLKNDSLTDC